MTAKRRAAGDLVAAHRGSDSVLATPAIAQAVAGQITTGKEHRLRWVRVGDLQLGPGYQRILSDRWAMEIARDFNPFLLRLFTVSEREDGSLWVIDGQHRVRALNHFLGRQEEEVECDVYRGLTYAEETLLCEAFVHSKPMGVLDYLRIKIERQDPDAIALVGAVEAAGLEVALGSGRQKGTIAAAGALVGVYESADAAWLTDVLRLLIDCFGLGVNVFVQPQILGIHGFLVRYHDHPAYVRAEFVRKVGGLGLGAVQQRAAVLVPTISGGNRATAFGKACQAIYNTGRRANFLPSWEEGVLTEKQRERRKQIADTLATSYGFKPAARGKGRAKHLPVLEEDVTL